MLNQILLYTLMFKLPVISSIIYFHLNIKLMHSLLHNELLYLKVKLYALIIILFKLLIFILLINFYL